MPISNWDQIPAIMNEVYRLQPKKVADLGIGFGKYGTLLREVLDGMHGRCRPLQWQHTVVGYEAFGGYRNPAWDSYSLVWEVDFTIPGHAYQEWDLILMVDSLEHLEPAAGAAFLDTLVEKNRHVIISVPVVPMPQGTTYGNKFEAHLTHYDGSEFERHNPVTLYKGMTQVFSIKGKLA